ncbi:DNA polymerase III subunit beta [Ferrigenium sp. UT5]|uniref:DNA polymerase III subunit beta n=1 Tax=Ferrigenium sp. UT5 TaxID=3242105 RepID=UPI0035510073
MFIKQINRNELLKPLLAVGGIVERKQPLPILSNVLLKKNERGMSLLSTDLEIQIEVQLEIQLPQNGGPEAITVSAKKLQDILKAIPEESIVNLDTQENKLQVKANKSKFSLQTLPAQDFPALTEQLEGATRIRIQQGKLKKLLNSVQHAMAQQDIRYYLNGVLMVIESNSIKMVATDGHRLAFIAETMEQDYPKLEVILSRKTVNELMKLLADNEAEIEIELAEKQVRFKFSNITMTSKVIDGKFPDYTRVIPNHSNHLVVNRVVLMQALQRAAILSNEKFRGVRLLLTENNLQIISSNSEQEEAQEDIEIKYTGQALDIGFNVIYLVEGMSFLSTEEVTLSFGDQNSSLLITTPKQDNYKYVVMPMRI